MAMIRWTPGSQLMNLHSEMDRLFDELAGNLGDVFAPWQRGGNGSTQAVLPVDIERTDDALIVRASVPGFDPNEVKVTVDHGMLTIEAQHEQQDEKRERNFVRRERFLGRMYRQIALPQEVRGDQTRAEFTNGVLTVTIPLAQKSEPRRIPVQPAGDASASQAASASQGAAPARG